MHVGERRRRDPCRERRCVQAVLGLKDEARVQDLGRARMRVLESGHPREVRGMPERGVRRDRLLATAPPDIRREDRRQLRRQPDRLAVLGLVGVVALARVLHRRRGDDRPKDVHWGAALGYLLEDLPQERRECPVFGQLRFEVAKLVFVRKIAIEQEISDLFVLGLADELFDPVAAVLEEVVADRGDRRGRRDHALETPWSYLLPLDGHAASVAQPCVWPGCAKGHKPWDLRPQTARGTVPAGRSGRLYRPGRTKHSRRARVHFLTRAQAVSPSSHPPAEGGGRKAGALSLWFRALLLRAGSVIR